MLWSRTNISLFHTWLLLSASTLCVSIPVPMTMILLADKGHVPKYMSTSSIREVSEEGGGGRRITRLHHDFAVTMATVPEETSSNGKGGISMEKPVINLHAACSRNDRIWFQLILEVMHHGSNILPKHPTVHLSLHFIQHHLPSILYRYTCGVFHTGDMEQPNGVQSIA